VPFNPTCSSANLALGQGDQPYPGKAQPLEQSGDILLVARQPIERLGDDDVELPPARVFEQALIGWPQCARAADRAIGVGVPILPAFMLDSRAAEPDLVLNRCVALQSRGIAGVYNRDHDLPAPDDVERSECRSP
jgi:hypothetical protein